MTDRVKSNQVAQLVGTVSSDSNNLSISWSGSGSGWSVKNTKSGGVLTISGAQIELPVLISGASYSLATSNGPVFMISEKGAKCGFLFSGPYLKTYDALSSGSETYVLSLLISNGSKTVWIDDPTIQFDPPDTTGGGTNDGKRGDS